MKILITDEVDSLLTKLLNKYNLEYELNLTDSVEKLLQIIQEFDGLIVRNRIKINSKFLYESKNLKFIARYGSGMESFDIETAEKLGIQCFNSAEGNANSVGEHCLGLLLSLCHKIYYAANQVENNIWERKKNSGIELENKIVGIIGYGHTGQAFAQKLQGFNCSILSYDKYKTGFSNKFVQEVDIQMLYENCDIISLHVPLNQETKYLINDHFICKMKKPFYLLNTSRGGVVSNNDLVKGLNNNKIIGAGLDVIENENFKFNKINADVNFNYLLNCKNVIITPHIAGLSKESNKKLSKVLIHKILKLI